MSAVGPAMADGAQQFDLVCQVSDYTDDIPTGVLMTVNYRVDLDKGEWCEGGCEFVNALPNVSDSRIVFELSATDIKGVNRQDGNFAWVHVDDTDHPVTMSKGHCTPAPFTPFPTTKF
jgi:hypothetical protein